MKLLLPLILALTISSTVLAKSYQVARIHGRITKVRGDRVKVQDDKNQIFWVDRTKANEARSDFVIVCKSDPYYI